MTTNSTKEKTELKTTALSLEILDLLKERGGAGVTELANELDLPPSTVHGHLSTLDQHEYVLNESGVYRLGPQLIQLGFHAQTAKHAHRIAPKYGDQLHERTGLRTTFVIEQHGRGVYFYAKSGDQANWKHESLGNRLHLHYAAVGKAILSELPEDRVDEIIDRWGLPARTDQTITDREALFEELESIRDQGYAINDGEMIDGVFAVGVPAIDPDGDPVGAFAVSLPRSAVDAERKQTLIKDVVEIVDQYELELTLGEAP